MNKILIPTDFSEHSNYALEYGSFIAKEKGGKLIILHITKDINECENNPHLEGISSYKFLNGVDYEVVVEEGSNISKSINKVGLDQNVDLIIMGSNGVSNVGEMLLGSNTENVIRNSLFNVLTIKHEMMGLSINSILFPSDFSPESYPVFETVIAYAKLFNAKIHLLRVVTSDRKSGSTSIDDRIDTLIEHFQLNENEYEKVIYRAKTKELGILNYSIDTDIDLIAIGTHGKGIVKKLLQENISQDLVRDSFRPVLTVRFP